MIPAKNRYDRQGNPLTDYEDIENKLSDNNYRVIKQDTVNIGSSDYFVSTVWLGLNQIGGTRDKPLIFETMIFIKSGSDLLKLDGYQQRYSTEEESLICHNKCIDMIQNMYSKFGIQIKED